MFGLPDWAPGIHPLIVHFPLALFFVAVMVDALALILKGQPWLRWSASGLYVLGAVSALAAFLSGREAAETVYLSASGNSLLTDHANWAEWTLWFYGVYGALRAFVEWKLVGNLKTVHALFFVIGAIGLFLVKETGEHGAQLVYQQGAGVANVAMAIQAQGIEYDDHGEELEHSHLEDGQHTDDHAEAEDHHHDHGEEGHDHTDGEEHEHHHSGSETMHVVVGGWKWDVGHDGAEAFKEKFQLALGDWQDVQIAVDHDGNGKDVIALQTNDKPLMFTAKDHIANLQYDLRINLSAFTGTLSLVHHVQNGKNYNFMEFNDKHIMLGRVVGGKRSVEDRGTVSSDGWLDVRVVSDGTHFRGYINKKMVVHGHGDQPAPGATGIYLKGVGVVMLDAFDVQVLE